MASNEAFARVKIDQLLKDAGWRLTDGTSVRYEAERQHYADQLGVPVICLSNGEEVRFPGKACARPSS